MKKSTKISLFISSLLVIAGLAVIFVSLLAVGFDMRKMTNITFEKAVYTVTDSFDKIHISDFTDNVEIHLSDDNSCKIICYDSEKVYHKYVVSNTGELRINYTDEREWYEKIGFFYKENNKIQVYLPQYAYQEIEVYTFNGDITLPKEFTFDAARLSTVNGKITLNANVLKSLATETTNGDIILNGNISGNIHSLTTNGKITAKNIVNAHWGNFQTTNGNIELNGDSVSELEVYSTNGSIKFDKIFSDRIKMRTVNGSITGTVLSDGTFSGKSVNGTVNLPDSTDGKGRFTFETVNGNISVN